MNASHKQCICKHTGKHNTNSSSVTELVEPEAWSGRTPAARSLGCSEAQSQQELGAQGGTGASIRLPWFGATCAPRFRAQVLSFPEPQFLPWGWFL